MYCVNVWRDIMMPKIKLSESEYQPMATNVVQLCYCFHLYSKGSEK